MLIEKDGITRNINEHRLSEYKAKGYVAVAASPPPEDDAPPPEDKANKKTGKE